MCVCVFSGEGCISEGSAESAVWEESSLSLPLQSQCQTAGRTHGRHNILFMRLMEQFTHWCRIYLPKCPTVSPPLTSLLFPPTWRLFWVSVTCWQLIPTSYMWGIPPPMALYSTLPIPNCRGRCWPFYAWTSSLALIVRARARVRPQLVYMIHADH